MKGTYTNPVTSGYFADPFVLRHEGVYYAYGTGAAPEDGGEGAQRGYKFEVLRSEDLVDWTSLGGALEPLTDENAQDYWAPEVAFHDGAFYMYYSAGIGDKGHQIRVAISEKPEGPFRDAGAILTPDDPFTIDASPFQDDDGTWYLYYARDFLDGERVGTALVVDRLESMTRLAGEPRTVLRATSDWQIFRKNREMYGNVYDWYTLEGPFAVKHDGQYYLFYSGGAWEEPNYGVSYAVAPHPLGPWVEPASDGPTILQSVPGVVVGPGHNCVVKGPDGHDYIVYHAWDKDKTARRMCVDRIDWTPEGPRTHGPSFEPQAIPQADHA
ncbi:glycoside hydrolase family 43 protein [Deinococcus peraridilitoris]|uniref:Putative beta-xylosidase n=1 Tax=Deinococcus peraridilitoris (strain DSM 19664 / LMG 22246 / CIP 109416 / KR-200) TaxID=937777 RepID=L0A0D1_DEIPD|nr:glycoside hydrolase family 43 protein [Deinococcus peraridilitoris]AFZ66475.1 putative beta-xylosidase [Deinococcus peraridilitoris DSM 19664]